MQEINFHLRGAGFMNQSVNLQLLQFCVVVHVLDEVFKFGDRINTVRQARSLSTARAAVGRQ